MVRAGRVVISRPVDCGLSLPKRRPQPPPLLPLLPVLQVGVAAALACAAMVFNSALATAPAACTASSSKRSAASTSVCSSNCVCSRRALSSNGSSLDEPPSPLGMTGAGCGRRPVRPGGGIIFRHTVDRFDGGIFYRFPVSLFFWSLIRGPAWSGPREAQRSSAVDLMLVVG
jgi:hypothetical protein